jgi:hypothetical protein
MWIKGADASPRLASGQTEETMTESLYLTLVLAVFGVFSAVLIWVDVSTKSARPPIPGPKA